MQSGTIRTLSTGLPESSRMNTVIEFNVNTKRIPVEDRAPSESGYDNPVCNGSVPFTSLIFVFLVHQSVQFYIITM